MALQLVERHGVVTREAVLAEGVVGGYAAVYGVLKVLEERGQVRRGYFVSGLGAAQFALPGAVDRLRLAREPASEAIGEAGVVAPPVVLAATDPAQPYGATLAWPDSPGRPARTANALVVLRDGLPIAWYDRRSHHLVTFPHTLDDRSWAEALADLVRAGRLRKVEVRKVDGDALASSPAAAEITAAAKAAGFTDGYRGLTFQSRSPVPRSGAAGPLGTGRIAVTSAAVDPAQAGPGELADLPGELVGVEVLAALDQPSAGALGQPDEGVGERHAMLLVDVGGDQRGDGLGHPGGHPAHGAG